MIERRALARIEINQPAMLHFDGIDGVHGCMVKDVNDQGGEVSLRVLRVCSQFRSVAGWLQDDEALPCSVAARDYVRRQICLLIPHSNCLQVNHAPRQTWSTPSRKPPTKWSDTSGGMMRQTSSNDPLTTVAISCAVATLAQRRPASNPR